MDTTHSHSLLRGRTPSCFPAAAASSTTALDRTVVTWPSSTLGSSTDERPPPVGDSSFGNPSRNASHKGHQRGSYSWGTASQLPYILPTIHLPTLGLALPDSGAARSPIPVPLAATTPASPVLLSPIVRRLSKVDGNGRRVSQTPTSNSYSSMASEEEVAEIIHAQVAQFSEGKIVEGRKQSPSPERSRDSPPQRPRSLSLGPSSADVKRRSTVPFPPAPVPTSPRPPPSSPSSPPLPVSVQPLASASSSSSPGISTRRRHRASLSITSILSSIFSSSSSSSTLSSPKTPRDELMSTQSKAEAFSPASWEFQVAIALIDAGQGRSVQPTTPPRSRQSNSRAPILPTISSRSSSLASRPPTHASATTAPAAQPEGHSHRRPTLDIDSDTDDADATVILSSGDDGPLGSVDLGGQGLGIAHLYEEHGHERDQHDDVRPSTPSTGKTSLNPITPKLPSSRSPAGADGLVIDPDPTEAKAARKTLARVSTASNVFRGWDEADLLALRLVTSPSNEPLRAATPLPPSSPPSSAASLSAPPTAVPTLPPSPCVSLLPLPSTPLSSPARTRQAPSPPPSLAITPHSSMALVNLSPQSHRRRSTRPAGIAPASPTLPALRPISQLSSSSSDMAMLLAGESAWAARSGEPKLVSSSRLDAHSEEGFSARLAKVAMGSPSSNVVDLCNEDDEASFEDRDEDVFGTPVQPRAISPASPRPASPTESLSAVRDTSSSPIPRPPRNPARRASPQRSFVLGPAISLS